MTFTFDDTVPATGHNPSVDYTTMQLNNVATQGIIAVDHIGFNTASGGTHEQVTLHNQSAPGLGTGDGVLYANLANSQSWPFWQNATGSFQLAGNALTAATNGSMAFPNGMIFKWGTQSLSGSSSQSGTVNFVGAFPANVFVVIPTLVSKVGGTSSSNDTIAIRQNSYGVGHSLSSFVWDFNGNGGSYTFFNWFAIGN